MLFKDLKVGYSVSIFDRDKIEFSQVKVTDITPPHFDNHYGNPTEMVIDITFEGQSRPYTFKENTEVGYINNLVIATERDYALREVEALKAQSDQAWDKRDSYKETSEKCSKILSENSPTYKEKRENEERFSKLESSVSDLANVVKELLKELKS